MGTTTFATKNSRYLDTIESNFGECYRRREEPKQIDTNYAHLYGFQTTFSIQRVS